MDAGERLHRLAVWALLAVTAVAWMVALGGVSSMQNVQLDGSKYQWWLVWFQFVGLALAAIVHCCQLHELRTLVVSLLCVLTALHMAQTDLASSQHKMANLGASINAALRQQAAAAHLAAALQLNETGGLDVMPYSASMPADFLVSVLDKLQLRPLWPPPPAAAAAAWPANPALDAQAARAVQAAAAYEAAQAAGPSAAARAPLLSAQAWQAAHPGDAAAAADMLRAEQAAQAAQGAGAPPPLPVAPRAGRVGGSGRRLLAADIGAIQTRTDVTFWGFTLLSCCDLALLGLFSFARAPGSTTTAAAVAAAGFAMPCLGGGSPWACCPHCGGVLGHTSPPPGGPLRGKKGPLRGGGQATFEVAAVPMLPDQSSRPKVCASPAGVVPPRRLASDLSTASRR